MALTSTQRRANIDAFVARFGTVASISFVEQAVQVETNARNTAIGFVKDNADPASIDSIVEVVAKVNADKGDVLNLIAAKADAQSVADLAAQVNTIEADLDYVTQNLPQ